MRSTQAICGTCQVTVAAINLACMGYNTSVNLIAEFLVGELKINFGSMTGCYDHGKFFIMSTEFDKNISD